MSHGPPRPVTGIVLPYLFSYYQEENSLQVSFFFVCDCTGPPTFTVGCGGFSWLTAVLGLFLELKRAIAT
jgi:hypothetical protein